MTPLLDSPYPESDEDMSRSSSSSSSGGSSADWSMPSDDLPDDIYRQVQAGNVGPASTFIGVAHPDRRQTLLGVVALCAVENAHAHILRWCFEEGFDVQGDYPKGLLYVEASYSGTVPVWEALLDAGMDLNRYARTIKYEVLGLAIGRNDVRLIETLLFGGQDPNLAREVEEKEIGHTAICKSNSIEILQLMLLYGWKPRNTRGEAQIAAAELGKLQELRMLILAGADINAVNCEWFASPLGIDAKVCGTPIFRAAMCGQRDVVIWLLRSGADIHFQDKQGRSVLWAARVGGNQELIGIMEELGLRDQF